jgi:hypothetical protein
MTNIPASPPFDQPLSYTITVQGRLEPNWAEWFDGMTVVVAKDRTGRTVTTITGRVPDQSALHGLLARIRDLGLPLMRVHCLEKGPDFNSPQPDLITAALELEKDIKK